MKNILKLISIHNIYEALKNAFMRFPFAMTVAAAWTVAALTAIHKNNVEETFIPKLLLVLGLAFVLYVATTLAKERQKWNKNKESFIIGGVTAFLVAYYLLLPHNIFESEGEFIFRHIMWMIGFIFLITFIPFVKSEHENKITAFWQYNVLLVTSVILTVFWAGAIQLGLSIAMASVDFLFDINIDGERYAELWMVLVGIFSTTFFLSRIPRHFGVFYNQVDYPKELRLFSQYVLVPLVTIYFLILYAYVIRIVITQEWPEGTLAYMILGFSFLAVLTYILLYPLRDTVEWVKRSGNIFFYILIPQVGMLFWALSFRISAYGITENRYLVFVFGVWLLLVALYFIFKKTKDIRIIPTTIFIIALLASFGPWGAFSVSERSQINRLEGLLVKNNLLVNGAVQKSEAPEEITFDDAKEISAVFRYLNNVHGYDKIQPWFSEDLDQYIEDEKGYRMKYERPRKIVEDILGIDYVESYEGLREDDQFFFLNVDFEEVQEPLDISGFDTLISTQSYRFDGDRIQEGIHTVLDSDTNELIIKRDETELTRIPLEPMLTQVRENRKQTFSREELTIEHETEALKAKLLIENLSGEITDGTYSITSLNGKLLFSTK